MDIIKTFKDKRIYQYASLKTCPTEIRPDDSSRTGHSGGCSNVII